MASLEEIRRKLQAQQQKSEQRSSSGDKAIYPFWNLPDNSYAELRFLPDGNPNNTFFWVERLVIKLPFNGVIGEHDKPIVVQVPCMEMYGKSCPILTETRPWWKDPSLIETARLYWKKRSYVFQGFVVKDGLDEKEPPENPIRRFVINPSIYEIIKNSLMDPDMEDLVVDFEKGRDFRLQKTKKGQYADYSTSRFVLKSRSLNDYERAAIEKFGLNDLKQFLPKEPSNEELEVIKEMFRASVDGEPYDPVRWGKYYKPQGMNGVGGVAIEEDIETSNQVENTVVTKPTEALSRIRKQVMQVSEKSSQLVQVNDDEESKNLSVTAVKTTVSPSISTASSSSGQIPDASKILEMIRQRRKQ
jgi:hypothetical protein